MIWTSTMRGWLTTPFCIINLIAVLHVGLSRSTGAVCPKAQYPFSIIDKPISVSIEPANLVDSISMSPGTYTLNEPLHTQIISSYSGWYLQIHADSLTSAADTIESQDIWITGKQEALPLSEPRTIIEEGGFGEVSETILLELRTSMQHKPGIYTGQLYIIVGIHQGPPPEIIEVPFEVEVACRMSGNISGNRMYFHYGIPDNQLKASTGGEITADTNICLSLTTTDGRIHSLPMIQSESSRTQPENCCIPLVWELRYTNVSWREPYYTSPDGREISWELAIDSEPISYELQCSPQPDAAQAPGDYGMNVMMSVAPLL